LRCALEIDPSLAEAHAALAVLKEEVDWDWAGAEAEYHRAIELNPNDAVAHHFYSVLLENLIRLPESMAENQIALALDPASPQPHANEAGILTDMRRYDEAITKLNNLIASNPEFPPYYGYGAEVYWHQGNVDAFVADTVMAMKKNGRAERAEIFESGYRKGRLQAACTGLIEFLKDRRAPSMSRPMK